MSETEVRVLAAQLAALDRRVSAVEADHGAIRTEQRETAQRLYDKIDRLAEKVDLALERRDDRLERRDERDLQGSRGSTAMVLSIALSVAAFAGTLLLFVLGQAK